jgi:acetoin utilization protein AcuB
MTTNVVTAGQGASIQDALALMKQHSIRHLPVVDKERNLVGWVTDADLRGVLIASMLEELSLEDVMVRKPHTADPLMSLEEAARLLVGKRIGGLPVVRDGKVIGIITIIDMLRAFITLIGMLTHSSRVDVKVSGKDNPLERITRLVQSHQAEIISICHLPVMEGHDQVYSIRLKKCDVDPIVTDMKKQGLEVVSAVA